jgi:hypothetical protein
MDMDSDEGVMNASVTEYHKRTAIRCFPCSSRDATYYGRFGGGIRIREMITERTDPKFQPSRSRLGNLKFVLDPKNTL